MRVYWLPNYAYQQAFCFQRQEYWTRLHVWPLAFLFARRDARNRLWIRCLAKSIGDHLYRGAASPEGKP